MITVNKHYISANELLLDSFKLATSIYNSDFSPTIIVGVWRGGTPVAIAVQEFFSVKDVHTEHTAIKTSSYYGINQQEKHITLSGLTPLIEMIDHNTRLLLVDDVFDTGRSMEAILKYIKIHTKNKPPKAIKIASPWFKPTKNLTELKPDYYLYETEDWLVFPHEISGLTQKELEQNKPELAQILETKK